MTIFSLDVKVNDGVIYIRSVEGVWVAASTTSTEPPDEPPEGEDPIEGDDPNEDPPPPTSDVPAWQQIIELAQADGWAAVYDPSNPNTRTFRVSGADQFVAQISDGLGNLPPLVQATASKQPKFLPGAFGELDGVEGAAGKIMATVAFSSPLAVPNGIVAVGQALDRSGLPRIIDAPSGNRHLIGLEGGKWTLWAGSYASSGPSDAKPHVFDSVFDGPISELAIDGGTVLKGNSGSSASLGSLSYGGKVGASSDGFWKGPMSVVAIHDNPTPEIRERMSLLLMKLAGVVPSRFSLLDESANLGIPSSQAVAFDGTYYYVSTSDYLYKFIRDPATGAYTKVASRNVSGDTPANKTQINGMHYFEGHLWVGANNWQNSPKRGWVVKYNPVDLTRVASYPVANHYAEGGAWKDVGDGPEYWAIYTDYDHVTRHRFNEGVWEQVGEYLLPLAEGQGPTNMLYQGAAWLDDLLITTRKPGPTAEIHIHRWTGSGFEPEYSQTGFGLDASGEQIQGLHWEADGVMLMMARASSRQTIIRAQYRGD